MQAAAPRTRGALILLEGVDRCGKSTQAKLLAEHLHGVLQNFPDRTTAIGSTINAYLSNACEMNDRAIHLLFSANRWEAADRLRSHLAQGQHVIMDRYSYSGVAFTAAKNQPGLTLEWCMQPEAGLPKPDVVIFLDITTEDAAKRSAYGEERYEKREFQDRVRDNFFRIMATEKWHVIDATKSIQEIHATIQQIAADCIARVASLPIQDIDV
ncbi:thymidylate kinase [Saprolegnia parasitica CBS 223.65]|uniref:Thymidylate kinase n=1 Tax=Saprolegnia parasitica (strain CBS 223.65) TaxID=695850 RepID=A0A067CJD2_SAPPC|nr:thymidylate kinase [Saprolegnia parasitica CBS 223.65]KDO26646.1 thymidylate kinase [Saprolegnia parasitica CBS 223.65]|eukprot:XP_012202783.1 thymidylate kinase [Saprolegnia parasitica CBS 223.65]